MWENWLNSLFNFAGVFILVLSILYCLRIIYDIVKVATLKEGKVEMGKYGLLYLGASISYIISYIIV